MSFSFNVFKICTTHCLFKLHIFVKSNKNLTHWVPILHLFVWLPPFLPAGTSLSCGCFFAEASKPFRDPRLGFLFAEEFPFPSPGPSSQFFFTPREHFLCSCALLRQDVCSLPPEFVRISGLWGEDGSGVFDSFCQKDLFSHKRMTFRGTLLGSLSFSGPDPEAFYWGCSGSHLFQWELFSFSSCFPHLLSTSHRLFEDHL